MIISYSYCYISLGRGTPSVIKNRTNGLVPIAETDLPDSPEAKILYETSYNGRLRSETQFGRDLLEGNQQLIDLRVERLNQRFNIPQIFGESVNGNPRMLQESILFFIYITEEINRTYNM